ncbi:hypothetical protein DNZ22_18570 [Salmonella enterica subsp. enterica serovar Newport]|nr:hypothetical protein [Salmonella enterica subsp. enterica serovar Newport]
MHTLKRIGPYISPEVYMTDSSNMVCIELDYDFKIVLPVEKGQELLRLLSEAEMYEETRNYGKGADRIVVKPMDKRIQMWFLSRTMYDVGKLDFLRTENATD